MTYCDGCQAQTSCLYKYDDGRMLCLPCFLKLDDDERCSRLATKR